MGPDLIPIKRYYLLSRLNAIKAKLIQQDLMDETLEILFDFIDVLSYETLIIITNRLLDMLESNQA